MNEEVIQVEKKPDPDDEPYDIPIYDSNGDFLMNWTVSNNHLEMLRNIMNEIEKEA